MKKFIYVLIGIVVFVLVIGVIGGDSEENVTDKAEEVVSVTEEESVSDKDTEVEETTETTTTEATTTKKEETIGQKNALRSAESYLRVSPFSYEGIIEQLEFEGYSYEDAVYAADNCGADWKEQAVKAAKNYLDLMSFSKQGLIEQLEFEGYTYEEAVYGAEQNGY